MKTLYYFSIFIFLFSLTSCDKKLDQPFGGDFNISGTVFLVTDSLGILDTNKIENCSIRLSTNNLDPDDYIISDMTDSFGYFQFNKISNRDYTIWAIRTVDGNTFQQKVSIEKEDLSSDNVNIANIYYTEVKEATVQYRIEGRLFYDDILTPEILPAGDAQITYTRTSPDYEITETIKANPEGVFQIRDLNYFDNMEFQYTYTNSETGEIIYKASDNFIVQDSVSILSPVTLEYESGGDLMVLVVDENNTPQNKFTVCLYSNQIAFELDTISNCMGNYTDDSTNEYGKVLFTGLPNNGTIYVRATKVINNESILQTTGSIVLNNSSTFQYLEMDPIH